MSSPIFIGKEVSLSLKGGNAEQLSCVHLNAGLEKFSRN